MSTTTTEKITSVTALTVAIETLSSLNDFDPKVVEKLGKIKEAYEKKAESAKGKNSTKGAENAAIGEQILEEMEQGKMYTLSDMMKFECLAGMELTTAKVRAFLNVPKDQGRIELGTSKGRVVYSLVD